MNWRESKRDWLAWSWRIQTQFMFVENLWWVGGWCLSCKCWGLMCPVLWEAVTWVGQPARRAVNSVVSLVMEWMSTSQRLDTVVLSCQSCDVLVSDQCHTHTPCVGHWYVHDMLSIIHYLYLCCLTLSRLHQLFVFFASCLSQSHVRSSNYPVHVHSVLST